MRSLVTRMLTVATVCGGVLAALPVQAAVVDKPLASDTALSAALAKKDKAAVGALLYKDFSWVDVEGVVRTKAQALDNLDAFAASDAQGAPSENVTRDYGQVLVARGIHGKVKYGHIWVKDGANWRAYLYQDTPVREVTGRGDSGPRKPTNNATCENPCKTTPFNEDTPAAAAVKKTWERIKTDEWQANAEDWDALSDVDHITISSTGALPKRPHVDELAKQHAAFGGAGAGVPVISGKLAPFGNVVIMTDLEGRNPAKPAAFALRMFIDRGQGWKICLSIHTEIGAGRAAEGN